MSESLGALRGALQQMEQWPLLASPLLALAQGLASSSAISCQALERECSSMALLPSTAEQGPQPPICAAPWRQQAPGVAPAAAAAKVGDQVSW
jgi:hypothetical protein